MCPRVSVAPGTVTFMRQRKARYACCIYRTSVPDCFDGGYTLVFWPRGLPTRRGPPSWRNLRTRLKVPGAILCGFRRTEPVKPVSAGRKFRKDCGTLAPVFLLRSLGSERRRFCATDSQARIEPSKRNAAGCGKRALRSCRVTRERDHSDELPRKHS